MRSRTLFGILFLIIYITKASAQYHVMVSTEYPPYNYLNKQGELVGFNVDIINAITKLYNLNISIGCSDWETTNKYLNQGKIDAIGSAHYTTNEDSDFIYSRSVCHTSHCFLYNKKNLDRISIDKIRSLKSPLIVLWKNDTLIRYLLSINPNARFIFVNNYVDLINELDKKEVTCAFSQKVVCMYYADILKKTYIKAGDEDVLDQNMGFKISKSQPQLARILDNGLEIIMSNGEYKKIYDKWIKKYNVHSSDNKKNLLRFFIVAGIIVFTVIVFLAILNYILQIRVKEKTKDIERQLQLNKLITIELEKQKIKAEESDKMKSAFLANMSHEIRTPMNGILGFTELLKSHDYSKDVKEHFIDMIRQSGERMLTTMNNIINISKIQAGVETLQISEIDFEKIINGLIHFFIEEAKQKGIELILEKKESSLDGPFYSDSYKVNSILSNLIKNALKFTLEGHVKIGYSITNSMARIYIEDTGIGIEKDKQSSIFDYFIQADFSHSSRFEGSGLGLSISKEYTKMLSGEIRIESELHKGATFFVDIPNHKNIDKPKHNMEANNLLSKLAIPKGLKVIVAEDDKISFFVLKYILEGISAEIFHAKNGLEAVELIQNHPDTDVILMDSKMPELNGTDAVKRIRKFNQKVFIIAQTAYTLQDYKTRIIEAGCNEYIEKPVDRNKLLEMIAKGVSGKSPSA